MSKKNSLKRVKAKQIFLGIDAHLARKIDNGGIQAVQSLSVEGLLLFAYKQLSLAEEVYAVYEAGPLGYVLYRRLRELGIRSPVAEEAIAPNHRAQSPPSHQGIATAFCDLAQSVASCQGS